MADKDPIFQRDLKRIANAAKDSEFSVVSYNILCDAVFDKNPRLYSYLPDEMKCRGPVPKNCVRHTQLVKELHWLDADVVCLQEVDPFYFPHLLEDLTVHGYEGMFQPHTTGGDGVATFFKTNKFQLKNYEVFGFNEILGEVVALDNFDHRNEHNQRLAQYTVLQDLNSGKEVVIVNVHLIFNCWREPDVHAIQAAIFFQQLYEVLPQSAKHTTSWIVCGDFNMRPHFPAYELVKNGDLSDGAIEKLRPGKYEYPSLTERKEFNDSKRNNFVHKYFKENLSHPFKYSNSAYRAVLGTEPKFTHYECDDIFPDVFGFDMMKDTLDYVWFSSDSLQANAVLEMVDEEVIQPFRACPNRYFPSDHLPLKAYFQFIDNVDSAYSSE
ncbi:glucose-repressible alcohol dehydrogenase transcriptional effector-like [Dendronephthya gigantea]|uniref:glucose-repressible alcohol dehydrogenase transcriptional effector-like n=1 Tax=Dendronephthya gigantea TaxID=151771 RepID=UPI00106C8D92|nr:glucose-repressible alcohol dehydrogenase transcriptional effector-like [Dendronephthya gigantea]